MALPLTERDANGYRSIIRDHDGREDAAQELTPAQASQRIDTLEKRIEAMEKRLDGRNITAGVGITVGGSGDNITISAKPQTANLTLACDDVGGTITVDMQVS